MFFALIFSINAWASPDSNANLLAEVLSEALTTLSQQSLSPHYIALTLEDTEKIYINSEWGAIDQSMTTRARTLDVDLRVGSPTLDSTHQLRGFSRYEGSKKDYTLVPFEDEPDRALRVAVMNSIDKQYRDARERFQMVTSEQQVKVEEEDVAADFQPFEAGHIATTLPPPLDLDVAIWEAMLPRLSALLTSDPLIHKGWVTLNVERRVKTLVDTEGAKLIHGGLHGRISVTFSTTTSDGDVLRIYKSLDVRDLAKLPSEAALRQWIEEGKTQLATQTEADRGSPYSGPVILSGQASGVFFHEVFGHRVEGHRQKRESEGKTFGEYLNKAILPGFLSVFDDPTIKTLEGVDLNGFYLYDDEGVPAARAELVDAGVFTGFLMGRSPIPDFNQSNGHGRRRSGSWPVSRMGNTIVEASKTFTEAQLRTMLISEIRRQGLEWGTIVDQIEGGFTMTGRTIPNAFNVRVTASRRVFADGRPDQPMRGIDLVGTPLVAFQNIVAASDTRTVFNGTCGAESGWVPVSAVAPSLLISKLEMQLKEKGQEKPPQLPKPIESDGVALGGDL